MSANTSMAGRQRGTASLKFLRIGTLGKRRLERLMARGKTPDIDALCGWEYRGMNIGAIPKLLGIQKFIKGFYYRKNGEAFGYNEPVRQNGPGAPWIAKPDDANPRRFGFYIVTPVDPTSSDNAYLHALLLDYGQGGNGRLDPTSALRDYLVQVGDGPEELFLGKAYLALGPLRLPVSYFVLERHRPTDYRR